MRFTRIHAPQTIQHVISRFTNREFLLSSATERSEYLRRVPIALKRSGWRAIGYALMSSHIHWVLLSGDAPISSFIHPLHTGFARWLNRQTDRLGPVFAGRPTTIIVAREHAMRLMAYVHNNPVRAGVARRASESEWTSHGAYNHLATPAWLDVQLGLELTQGGTGKAEQAAFNEYVHHRASEERDPVLSGRHGTNARAELRRRLDAPIELSSAVLEASGAERREILLPANARRPNAPGVAIEAVFAHVATALDLPAAEFCSATRTAKAVEARFVAISAARQLGHRLQDAAAAVGLASSSAASLFARAPERREGAVRLARAIAETLRRDERALTKAADSKD